ncbi:MAG: thioredoxin [Oscillospiraceae bacterium]|jgi:thioredoxin 1|nr:thioredoxin [Oscillospiraceae bacterium]
MAKEVLNLTKETMEDAVAVGLTLVDFWADWCGPCKMLAPILQELYEERGDFKLAKVNIDKEQELAEGFAIQSVPTVVLFRDGKAELAAVGVRGKATYEEMLDANFNAQE